jgi:hypothetical protein
MFTSIDKESSATQALLARLIINCATFSKEDLFSSVGQANILLQTIEMVKTQVDLTKLEAKTVQDVLEEEYVLRSPEEGNSATVLECVTPIDQKTKVLPLTLFQWGHRGITIKAPINPGGNQSSLMDFDIILMLGTDGSVILFKSYYPIRGSVTLKHYKVEVSKLSPPDIANSLASIIFKERKILTASFCGLKAILNKARQDSLKMVFDSDRALVIINIAETQTS